MSLTITGAQVLGADGFETRDLFIVDGAIAEDPAAGAEVLEGAGLYAAPGIVDLHGDGFERNFSPRPGVFFDIETALIETDRQLLANGITTGYLALTISWEPGLRSLENARRFIDAWTRLRPSFVTDMRIQLRWETAALDAVEDVEAWLQLDPAPTLAFNDHFSLLLKPTETLGRDLTKYAARAGLTAAEYEALTRRTEARLDEVPAAIKRLAKAAAAAGVPCFSHDEMTAEARRAHRTLGIAVSEFPMTREAAQEAVAGGEATVLGAPNVVRGGSHIGALDAAPAAREGLCAALASDYYYPSQMQAAARLLDEGEKGSADVWSLVSGGPARAVGFADRGALATGTRADVVLFRRSGARAEVVATIAEGRVAFRAM
ncbi:MAG: alpha-D-ribose 1-methylphosphonate 5-triphosphate diphosphatase [Pseudomonadota bacterium]